MARRAVRACHSRINLLVEIASIRLIPVARQRIIALQCFQ
eukprot:COSAG02_NODE_30080_length_557_cov_1.543668_1_plen_39_part_10